MRDDVANGFDPSDPAARSGLSQDEAQLLERRSSALSDSYRLFYSHPVSLVRGEGAHLFDAEGRDYLDMYNNVPVLGHSHPAVTEAVTRQLSTLNTHTRYLTSGIIDYSEALLATFPGALDRVTYTCSGSEAVDLAVRMARFATGRQGIIVTTHAYHGTTALAAGLSPSLTRSRTDLADAHVLTIPAPVAGDAESVAAAAAATRAAIAEFDARGVGTAAVLIDSICSSDGVIAQPVGWLPLIAEEVRKAGGLWIADEVQPGFARTGTMWGFERHGDEVCPDIAALGKPMGNGMPIAAVVHAAEAGREFGQSVRYFNTFGGNPVSIAAAQVVLDTIQARGLAQHSADVGEHLRAGVEKLAEVHGLGQVRGAGLFVGVDVVDPASGTPDAARTQAVVDRLREARILISASGREGATLKVRPPLAIDKSDIDRFLTELDRVLGSESEHVCQPVLG